MFCVKYYGMGLRLKQFHFEQLMSLIKNATCDDDCVGCPWKNMENYNFAEYCCLLMELRDLLPKEENETP